ncbi:MULTISPECIES: hypothetical protein [unclassified Rhizobium]|uniref:hypothetical protein n=1 Tax=unclassified Rhizobium TaxID=2613769 RepID=UPI00214BB07D|nr:MULTISPECIES: hypothetical protein [unclassified Rhizobium]
MWITTEDVTMGAFRNRHHQTGLAYDLIPPEAQQPARSLRRFERSDDIVDAEFVIVQPGRGSNFTARSGNDNHRRHYPQPRKGMASAALLSAVVYFLRAGESWLQRASGRSFAVLIVVLFVLVFGLVGGFSGLAEAPVRVPPIAASPLQFTHVSLTPRDANGMHILVLNGIIDNVTAAGRSLPEIRADLYDGNQLLASVMIAPPSERIGGGESRGFSARLPHQGEKMPEVRLSFVQAGADGR